MQKVILFFTLFVTGIGISLAQVRITEVKPIDKANDPTFFELFYNGSTNLKDYTLVVYVNTGTERILTVSTFPDFDFFAPSSTDQSASTHTRGAVVFSQAQIITPSSYSRMYSDMANVKRYNVGVNNQVGTGVDIIDKDPFNINPNTSPSAKDIETNHKIALFLFNRTTLVDLVTDIDSINTIDEFGSIIPFPSSNGYQLNLNVPILLSKKVSRSLGASTSYQLQSVSASNCIYRWFAQTTPDRGVVNFLVNNTATWDHDYFFWTSSSAIATPNSVSSYSQFNEVVGAIQQNGSYLSNGKFEYFLQVINPTQFSNPSDPGLELKLSIFADKDISGSFTSGDFYLQEYPVNGRAFTVNDKYNIYVSTNGQSTQVTAYKISFDRSQIKLPTSNEYYRIYMVLTYIGASNCYAPSPQIMEMAFALPAELSKFKISNVEKFNRLNWITSSERNNKGFEIQRSIGAANEFKTIGFLGSMAKNGNSQTEISYSFEDADIKSGQTYNYRLNQIDYDGRSMFSPIRSIRIGSIESNLLVYPNPSQGSFTVNTGSSTGKINIYVLDNTGRSVSQYTDVSSSNTRINNLKKGFYTLKIVNTETGEQSAQRVVVQ